MQRVVKGSERSFRLSMKPIGNVHLVDCTLKIEAFVYSNKLVQIDDSYIFKNDDDSYDIIIVSKNADAIGKGDIKLRVHIGVPDGRFPDKYRNEIYDVCVG